MKSPAQRARERVQKDIAYVDPFQPGIVRFYNADALDGVLAGTRAQWIADALNAYGPPRIESELKG